MQSTKVLVISIIIAISSIFSIPGMAQSAPEIAKLAKEFNISPKDLTKFNKAGLSVDDLKGGLEIASEVAESGKLDMKEAADKVLSLREEGKDWSSIAKEFDVPVPAGL